MQHKGSAESSSLTTNNDKKWPHKRNGIENAKYPSTEVKQSILIIGLSGNGKRCIGNSILEEIQFEVDGFSTIRIEQARGKRVIIFPDITDVPTANANNTIKEMKNILLRTCDDTNGIDAIVFVFKYGVRFTKQEKDAVESTKYLFGENVFKYHVILAFSYGDNFEVDHKESKLTFQQWCWQQQGDMRNLLQEVDYRCVLFNNTTMDEIAKKTQVVNLMSLICAANNNKLLKASKNNHKSFSSLDDHSTGELQEHRKDAKQARLDNGIKRFSVENDFSCMDSANKSLPIDKKYTHSDFKMAQKRYSSCIVC